MASSTLGELVQHLFCKIVNKSVDWALHDSKKRDLKELETALNVLGCVADDVKKKLQEAEKSPTKKRKTEVHNWLGEVEKVKSEVQELKDRVQEVRFLKKFFCGSGVASLYERVKLLIEQRQHFGELVLNDCGTRGEPLLTTKMFGKEFEENLKTIFNNFVFDKKFTSIGIYGMGGVGKTTLAKHIHNMLQENSQACVCWVTFSGQVSIKKLQDEIAKALHVDLANENDENKRAATLYRAVSQGKDAVFIFDDMWQYINLDMLGIRPCVENCRLIITSRSLEVCNKIGCEEKVEVRTLNDNDALNLFKVTLGHYIQLSLQVQETVKLVARECDGLPLGIVTMATTMRGVTDIHDWSNALAELKETRIPQLGDMENVFGVLQYSFNRLDPDYSSRGRCDGYTKLQLCFLYCSMYPEDHEIPRDELINKFISEELIEHTELRRVQFDQGHAILNKLVNLCLLENVGGKYGVKMHGLMRDMALIIAKVKPKFIVSSGPSLMNILNEKVWTRDVEKLSLMKNQISKIPFQTSPVCPKLSTLILSHNPLEYMPDSFFNQMLGLCILDLSSTKITTLPTSLSNLVALRMLLLGDCDRLQSVPDLTNSKTLRELDLSHTKIIKMPQGMENLVNLKCLRLVGIDNLEPLSNDWLHSFPSLQQLILPLHIEAPIEEIETLEQLEQFGGRLKNCSDFNRFIESRRSHVYYHVYVGEITADRTSFSAISENIYGNLVFLNVGQKDGVRTMLRLENDVIKVDERDGPSRCFLADSPQSNSPGFNKTCTISYSKDIEHIVDSCCFLISTFVEIHITGLDCLKGILSETGTHISPQLQQGAFSLLEILSINNCNKIKKLGLPVKNLKSLKSISIDGCKELEVIFEVDDDMIGGANVSLPNLKELTLVRLPRLEIICKDKIECNAIEKITLVNCHKLNALPFGLPGDQDGELPFRRNLRVINISHEDRDWWDSLEWERPFKNALHQFVRYC